MHRMMMRGFAPLAAFGVMSMASPALAGSYAIERVNHGAPGLSFGLILMGLVFLVGFTATIVPRTVSIAALVGIGVAMLLPVIASAQTAAASNTVLDVQWGSMVSEAFKALIEASLPFASLAITALAGRMAWWGPMIFSTSRVDRALRTGADYAINAVAGATHDKALSVDVGYEVLKVGLERILGSTPNWLIKELGGAKGIVERLFRVFKFDETVTDKNTLQRVLDDLPSFPFVK